MASLVLLALILQGVSQTDGAALGGRDIPILDVTLSGQNTDSPNGHVNTSTWIQGMNNPNATGHFPIVGYDVSQPFGPGNPIDGWSLDVNVTDNMPSSGGQGLVTGSTIRINPPPSLVAQTSNGSSTLRADGSTWRVCISAFSDLVQSTIDAGRSDNGSCTTMFGEQCVLDIRSTWASAWSDGHRNANGCPSFVLPPRCEATVPQFIFVTTGIDLNGTRFIPGKTNIVEIASLSIHQPGNNTDYNRIGATTRPVIVSWGFGTQNNSSVKLVAPPPTLACIKPNKALNGSQMPAAASQLGRMPGWIFGSLAVAAALAFV